MKIISLISIFFLIFSCSNPLHTKRNVIKKCFDGDTCTTITGEKIRLACIDTPEIYGDKSDQIRAHTARDFLNNLVAGQQVDIRRIAKDQYGRTVAELFINQINIQEQIVANKHGIIKKRYSDLCPWIKEQDQRSN